MKRQAGAGITVQGTSLAATYACEELHESGTTEEKQNRAMR